MAETETVYLTFNNMGVRSCNHASEGKTVTRKWQIGETCKDKIEIGE